MKSNRKEYKNRIEYQNEHGQLHRLGGPAIEWSDGTKKWFINDILHREDGPAVEWYDGNIFYYLKGVMYSEEEWKEEILKLKLNRIKDL